MPDNHPPPRGEPKNPGGSFFFRDRSAHHGEETPGSCSQAEKVMGGGTSDDYTRIIAETHVFDREGGVCSR